MSESMGYARLDACEFDDESFQRWLRLHDVTARHVRDMEYIFTGPMDVLDVMIRMFWASNDPETDAELLNQIHRYLP